MSQSSPSTSEQHAHSIRPDTLLSSISVLLLVSVVQRSIGFGRGMLFCRWLDPTELGHWDMAYGFLLLAAPLSVLGLPGSFRRYLERYRQRGQFRTFLLRTVVWTATLSLAALTLLIVFRKPFAYLVFGSSENVSLLLIVSATLATVIVHHFLEAVFAGMRLYRVVSCMHVVHSIIFATLSLSLLVFWRTDARSVVLGYGGACICSAIGVLVWSRRLQGNSSSPAGYVPHRDFWPPLLRFAIWIWVADLFSNLFTTIDRYMILHYSNSSSAEAMEMIGNYHSSMLIPLLLVSVAHLLAGAITPHLSYDWELGHRDSVMQTLERSLKLISLGMFAAGVGVLLVAPTLFQIVFDAKYAQGLSVLPWTVVTCGWFSLLVVSQTYLWCAEKSSRATIPLACGIVVNILLNLLLLPWLGLAGAAMATSLATGVALAMQLWMNYLLGMKISVSTVALCFCPLLLAGGTQVALISATIIGAGAIWSHWLLTREEQAAIVTLLRQRLYDLPSTLRPATDSNSTSS